MKRDRNAALTTPKHPPARARRDSAGASAPRALKPSKGNARLRADFRAWRAALPTALERDTLLMPDAIAESVLTEAVAFLNAELPAGFADRLAAKAHWLYPRHKQFHKALNRPGNGGRDSLYMYMRHWICGWLKRENYALYKRLPWDYALGRRLPATVAVRTQQ